MTVSAFIKNTVYFVTGKIGYFRQRCTDDGPSLMSDHTINFYANKIAGITFSSHWDFQDTTLVKVAYFHEGEQVKDALKLFRLKKQILSSAIKAFLPP